MKLPLLFIAFTFTGLCAVKAQTTIGPAEKRMTDSLCNALSHVDMSKVTSKEEATTVFTECFSRYSSLLLEVAEERKADMSDHEAMRKVGIEIGKDLLRQNCAAFLQISSKMAGANATKEETSVKQGILKRIETKGFNYIVIADQQGKETQFLWLRQFAGSEKFTAGLGVYAGKKVRIKWQEIEAYIPQAKEYYKVKEIVSLDIY